MHNIGNHACHNIICICTCMSQHQHTCMSHNTHACHNNGHTHMSTTTTHMHVTTTTHMHVAAHNCWPALCITYNIKCLIKTNICEGPQSPVVKSCPTKPHGLALSTPHYTTTHCTIIMGDIQIYTANTVCIWIF